MGFLGTDLYALLGINHSASPEEIKKAYKQQVFLHHPDRQGPEQLFLEIVRAYQVLSDPQKRAEYDVAVQKKTEPFEYTPQGKIKIRKEALNKLVALLDALLEEENL